MAPSSTLTTNVVDQALGNGVQMGQRNLDWQGNMASISGMLASGAMAEHNETKRQEKLKKTLKKFNDALKKGSGKKALTDILAGIVGMSDEQRKKLVEGATKNSKLNLKDNINWIMSMIDELPDVRKPNGERYTWKEIRQLFRNIQGKNTRNNGAVTKQEVLMVLDQLKIDPGALDNKVVQANLNRRLNQYDALEKRADSLGLNLDDLHKRMSGSGMTPAQFMNIYAVSVKASNDRAEQKALMELNKEHRFGLESLLDREAASVKAKRLSQIAGCNEGDTLGQNYSPVLKIRRDDNRLLRGTARAITNVIDYTLNTNTNASFNNWYHDQDSFWAGYARDMDPSVEGTWGNIKNEWATVIPDFQKDFQGKNIAQIGASLLPTAGKIAMGFSRALWNTGAEGLDFLVMANPIAWQAKLVEHGLKYASDNYLQADASDGFWGAAGRASLRALAGIGQGMAALGHNPLRLVSGISGLAEGWMGNARQTILGNFSEAGLTNWGINEYQGWSNAVKYGNTGYMGDRLGTYGTNVASLFVPMAYGRVARMGAALRGRVSQVRAGFQTVAENGIGEGGRRMARQINGATVNTETLEIVKINRAIQTGETIELSPHRTRFSQESVSFAKKRNGQIAYTYEDIFDGMWKDGWNGDPIDIVKLSDGSLTSIDNTRILAARRASINIQAKIHGFDEILPKSMRSRFPHPTNRSIFANTWGEAAEFRVLRQKKKPWLKLYAPRGTFDDIRITGIPEKWL